MNRPDPHRLIALGRVIDAWGVKGWVKVEPYAQGSDTALTRSRQWHLARSQGVAVAPIDRWVTLERARRHSLTVVAKPLDCADREAALALKGAEVSVRRSDFPPLQGDEVYWVDLLGCELSNREGQSLGCVVAVDDHGAHPILKSDTGTMIPFVEAYVLEVLPEEGRIVVDWQTDW